MSSHSTFFMLLPAKIGNLSTWLFLQEHSIIQVIRFHLFGYSSFFSLQDFYLVNIMCMCVCSHAMACIWMSEDNLWESFFSLSVRVLGIKLIVARTFTCQPSCQPSFVSSWKVCKLSVIHVSRHYMTVVKDWCTGGHQLNCKQYTGVTKLPKLIISLIPC